jgi:predicted glycoside hydrolase/deacetylase ChbG (UPF0249 family)
MRKRPQPPFQPTRSLRNLAIATLLVGSALATGPGSAAVARASEPSALLLIRVDDIGMNHTVNTALRKLIHAGVPFSASVMVACPWFLEAAEILRDQPNASIGIHLTLNSEWQHYKWGPVLGASRVPSLVDDNGYFHTSGEDFAAAEIDLHEVRAELKAQIERARGAGLEIDYLDYHMLTAVSTPELRNLVEDLAKEYGLGLSRYFGERSASLWDVEPERKLQTMLDVIARFEPDRPNLLVIHLGLETPEMKALVDVNNPTDPYRVAEHRRAELDALLSPAFLEAVSKRGIRLATYGDLIEVEGLNSMSPPAFAGYSMTDPEE